MVSDAAGFPRPFGDYLLLSSFGRGGMGEVFLAKRTAFEGVDRLCVVKTLRGELASDEEYIRRFLDEARVVVQLHHANISQVFDAGQVGNDYFMAMEYVSGTNLRDLGRRLVQAGVALEPGIALYLVSETLDALAYAHRLVNPMTGGQLGIVHRDVSPHNVMLSFEGEVKLIDFGLAESALKQEHTESAIVLGKVAYMSPEQARGEVVDATCDQFAAAVMAYELLTHERFYGNLRTHEIWQIVGRGNYSPRLLDTLDPEVQQILRRAWDADPSRRYPSCEAMREALDDFRALRYPRVGKKQARALMQGIYQERILDERQLLRSYAELSSPGRRASEHSHTWDAPSSSQVATHGVASNAPLSPVEMTVSSSTSGEAALSGPNLDEVSADGPLPPPDPDGPERSSTLTRQERAFQASADSPVDATAPVPRSGPVTPSPVAAGEPAPRSRALPVALGLLVVVLLALVVVLLLRPDAAPAEVTDAVADPPPQPAPVDTPTEAPTPVPVDAGHDTVDDAGAAPAPTVASIAEDDDPPRRRRRRRRRSDPRPTPTVDTPEPTPSPEPEPKPVPVPVAAKPADKASPPKTDKPPQTPPLGKLSITKLKAMVERCDGRRHRCAKSLRSAPHWKTNNSEALRRLLEQCAFKCDGWVYDGRRWRGRRD